jgi:hypothetical protein
MMRRPQPTTAPVVVIKRKIVKPASALPVAEKPSPPAAAEAKPLGTNGAKKPALAKPEPVKPQPVQKSPPVPSEPVVPLTTPLPTVVTAQEPAHDPAPPSKKDREREEAYQLLCRLSETFPDVFVRDFDKPIRPLAIGIRHAVAALLPEIPAPKIGKAIGLYTALVRREYLTALGEGQSRINLEGISAGVPTEKEREAAKAQLAVWQEKWRERKKRQFGQVSQVGAVEAFALRVRPQ